MQKFSSQEIHRHPLGLPVLCMIPLPPRYHHHIHSNKLVEEEVVVESRSVYWADAKGVLTRRGLRVR